MQRQALLGNVFERPSEIGERRNKRAERQLRWYNWGRMESSTLPPIRVDRTVIVVAHLTDEPDDNAYWHARTPQERLRHMELLRRINYGSDSTARLQRVLEITERA